MKEIIERETGLVVWVQGVVAVWGKLPEGVVERDKVLYVPATRLVETLQSRPSRLTEAQCLKVRTLLAALPATTNTATQVAPDSVAPTARSGE